VVIPASASSAARALQLIMETISCASERARAAQAPSCDH